VSTLVREYLEPKMRVANTLGHTLRLIPYNNGVFEAGISDPDNLNIGEDEVRKYTAYVQKKPKYNHIEMNIKIVTSLCIEVLKDAPEWKMERERMAYTRQLQNSGVWVRILEKKSTQYQPALVLIGADPNDDRKEIKSELLK